MDDDNIVKFPNKSVDPEVEEAQELLNQDDSDSILIVYNKEGKFSFVVSNPDPKEVLFGLEIAKYALLSNYVNGTDMEYQ